MRNTKIAAAITAALLSPALPVTVYATNGMNLEGYGPIARGMGGASMAYDNGMAAVMNNPATLGLSPDGQTLDLALGFLGPNVKTSMNMPGMSMSTDSDADAFWIMPAGLGWSNKRDGLTYGVGMFAQGGMGTEYKNSFLGLGSGTVRSEVGVARLILPLAYSVSEQLKVGATLDYSYAMMDIQMAMPGSDLGAMMMRGAGMDVPAAGEASGTMAMGMQSMGMNPTWARFDFSNGSPFTGKTRGGGFAGKIGAVYQVTPEFSVGATYHTKTFMSDLKTNDASLSMEVPGMGTQTVRGDIRLKDFEWPATWGLGVAYRMNDWLFAADIKRIEWASVMDSFNMSFTANADPMNGPFANGTLDAKLYQDWEDQTALAVGVSYRYSEALTLRAGFNIADNPIPDRYLNFLFPAIIKTHINFGVGYDFDKTQGLNFALVFSPEVEQTNSSTGMTTTHSQYAWELMYSKRF